MAVLENKIRRDCSTLSYGTTTTTTTSTTTITTNITCFTTTATTTVTTLDEKKGQ